MNEAANSTKGAENIVVVPAFLPSKATITVSRPTGYFEFNTGVPTQRLLDKTISIYAISRCSDCKELSKRVFVSEDQDRQNATDGKQYVTIKDWILNTHCKKAELSTFSADSVLSIVSKQPGLDLDKMTAASALTGTPALLNFLTNLTTVLGVFQNAGDFEAFTLSPGKIKYGQFLSASPLYPSANTGFNFSPSRDMSEAALWNPSAIAFSRKPNNVSLLTNLKNNVKFSGFFKVKNNISIAIGGVYTNQDELRNTIFKRTSDDFQLSADSTMMKLKEYTAVISGAYKATNKLSFGVAVKSIWQDFTIPQKLFIKSGIGAFSYSNVKKQGFDVDVSATYRIANSLQAGVNLMNLTGSKLYSDAFVSGQQNVPILQQRSLGIGLTYKVQRFNMGADAIFNKTGFYDLALGANYVPFNNALIAAGIAVKQLNYSLAFRLKHFRLAYINDNAWLINERKSGKSKILNGRLYGGFVFDLN